MQRSNLGRNLSTKKTRKREFLEQMQQVVPWKDLVALIAPTPLRDAEVGHRFLLRCCCVFT
jgi:hypothetical protein